MFCLVVLVGRWLPAQDIPSNDDLAVLHRLVEKFCVECHRSDKPRGDVALDTRPGLEDLLRNRNEWSMAASRIEEQAMPPRGKPAPSDAERLKMSAVIRGALSLDRSTAPKTPWIGQVTVRRLSRSEYVRTVRDLLGVGGIQTEALPEDAVAHSFDNLGDVASTSALVIEKYLDMGAWVAARVIEDPTSQKNIPGLESPAQPSALDPDVALGRFLLRAFRRPARPEEIADRRPFFQLALAPETRTRGLDLLVRSVLSSPNFLYRLELRHETPRRLNSFETATRLSYFLWSSMPDDQLLEKAAKDELNSVQGVRTEAMRLLKDPRARVLAEDFAAAWLRFRDVLQANADFRRYPQIWNGGLRPSMYEEAVHFCDYVFRENQPLHHLISAPYTFLNETMAKHYEIADVAGGHFRRVEVGDHRRGGVVTMSAVLMSTSYPLRTSPVLRGKWLLETLLDDPPGPPPPEAGTLPPDDLQPDKMTPRERLARHRRDPACAACHDRIDPLGFSLENYDVLGRWRETIHDQPIDARGVLSGGHEVNGPNGLKDELLRRKVDIYRSFLHHLFVYAVGRPSEDGDAASLAALLKDFQQGGETMEAAVLSLVSSPVFLFVDKRDRP